MNSTRHAAPRSRRLPSVILAAVLALGLLFPPLSARAAVILQALIDADGNPVTGCTVATPAGPFAGVEYVNYTRIDLAATPPVGPVTQDQCVAGALVPDPAFVPLAPATWPVGVGAAGGTVDVVESYVRLSALLPGARLGFVARTDDGSLAPSALLTRSGVPGGPAIILGAVSFPSSIPGLGQIGAALATLSLIVLATRLTRRHRHAAGASALLLLAVAGLAWAAVTRDGDPSDWGSMLPIVQDTNPAVPGTVSIQRVYASAEGNVLQLRYDLDLGIRANAPQADGPYAMAAGSNLNLAAPGLLGNDQLGHPAATLREFRPGGAGPTYAAGTSVAFAGGVLSVQADGSFSLAAPTTVGSASFDYRIGNGLSPSNWATASVIVGAGPTCGNGVVNAGEACDDGNTITETACAYGTATCTACNATCSAVLNLSGPTCGDGAVNGSEACDDGNATTETACAYRTASCTACNATCSAVLNLSGPTCGDGAVNGGEVCDDNNTISETACAYGTASCIACNATCTAVLNLSGPVCGDGSINGGEVCDDGNKITETACPYGTTSCTACNASCSAVLILAGGYCGDSAVNGGEECDDGNNTSGDGCSSSCTSEAPAVCGDGIRSGSEVRDDGNITTETACAYGTISCTACNASCSAVLNLTGGYCGDGTRNGSEACDDGNNTSGDGCSSTCQSEAPAICGDGIRNGSEACDDGNNASGDGCSSTCTLEP